jgi:hypothetical protein
LRAAAVDCAAAGLAAARFAVLAAFAGALAAAFVAVFAGALTPAFVAAFAGAVAAVFVGGLALAAGLRTARLTTGASTDSGARPVAAASMTAFFAGARRAGGLAAVAHTSMSAV